VVVALGGELIIRDRLNAVPLLFCIGGVGLKKGLLPVRGDSNCLCGVSISARKAGRLSVGGGSGDVGVLIARKILPVDADVVDAGEDRLRLLSTVMLLNSGVLDKPIVLTSGGTLSLDWLTGVPNFICALDDDIGGLFALFV
jgi:hypothetical protein